MIQHTANNCYLLANVLVLKINPIAIAVTARSAIFDYLKEHKNVFQQTFRELSIADKNTMLDAVEVDETT